MSWIVGSLCILALGYIAWDIYRNHKFYLALQVTLAALAESECQCAHKDQIFEGSKKDFLDLLGEEH